jgi:hypothetical protein
VTRIDVRGTPLSRLQSMHLTSINFLSYNHFLSTFLRHAIKAPVSCTEPVSNTAVPVLYPRQRWLVAE